MVPSCQFNLLDNCISCSQILEEWISIHIVLLLSGFGLVGVLHLVTGIIGAKYCSKPEKANICFLWGIIAAIAALLGIIIFLLLSPRGYLLEDSLWGIYLWLFISPVLYIIGAVRNRRSY